GGANAQEVNAQEANPGEAKASQAKGRGRGAPKARRAAPKKAGSDASQARAKSATSTQRPRAGGQSQVASEPSGSAKPAAAAATPQATRRSGGASEEGKPTQRVPKDTKRRAVRAPAASRDGSRRPGASLQQQPEGHKPDRIPASAVQEHLFEIQSNLDSLLRDVDRADGDAEARRRAAEAIGHIAARLDPEGEGRPSRGADGLMSAARQLLSVDYYARQWSRRGMRYRSDEVDDFGLDPAYEQRVQPLLDLLFRDYFRVQFKGIEHIPERGGALIVCNRGGALPWDGLMLKTAVRNARGERGLRWLAEDLNFHAPFLGPFLNRMGAVRACQENADMLLDRGTLVAVFPEGIKGVGKTFAHRYQLQRFARGGHVKLALRKQVPILPAAIVGAEDAYPMLFRVKFLAKALGVPFFPVTPTFPLLGPAGLLPLPSRWQILVGPPLRGLSGREPDDAQDTVLVNELNEQLRATVQQLLSEALALRGSRVYM
ncbi:MAG: lysophospholipid acyltransferase family protein, partial [Myxococcales bacterium]|nr:lysophospholipid acyltransferase family protein [Myxococcales bacterium]